jgi:hypothetical protein
MKAPTWMRARKSSRFGGRPSGQAPYRDQAERLG